MKRILSIVLSITLVSMLFGAVGASAAPASPVAPVAPSVDAVGQLIQELISNGESIPADLFVKRSYPKNSITPFAYDDDPLREDIRMLGTMLLVGELMLKYTSFI